MSYLNPVQINPLIPAIGIFVAQAVILGVAFRMSPSSPTEHFWIIPAVAVIAAALAAFFHARRWWAVQMLYFIGLVVGNISALQVSVQGIDGVFAVAAATVGMFAVLGLVIGFFAELVRMIHSLIHGGNIWSRSDEAKKETR